MHRTPIDSVVPSAGGGIARGAVALCDEAGIDTEPLIRKAGLTRREIDDAQLRLGAANQVMLLNLAAEALDDDVLGFHLAERIELRETGLIYFVLASSATYGDALNRASRYSIIANEGLRLERLRGEGTGIRYNYIGLLRHTDRHQLEFWITALVRLTRQLTGTRAVPVRVAIAHPRSLRSHELEACIGCPVDFSAQSDEVAYEAELGELPLVAADPYLHELLVSYCEAALAHRGRPVEALRTRVENAITPLLPHGKARAEDVARELGMGVRTMSRRLSQQGLTFSGILDALRADLARHHLKNSALSISQIAWLLGFQEVSAFTHAFRRWTGHSPSRARTSQRLAAG
jgi:AraC-like DNA-binding protein